MIKINPARVTISPVGMDDVIVSGMQFEVDPNGQVFTLKPGRIKINSLFMDMDIAIETDFGAAPMGNSLMVLDQTMSMHFIQDNLSQANLVIGVITKKTDLTLVTAVVYSEEASSGSNGTPLDVFNPAITTDMQIKMLFDEMAQNKTSDIRLRYEEMLEALPVAYNAVFLEDFNNTINIESNDLLYNPYSKTVALGVVPPYPVDSKIMVQSFVLPNDISQAYVSIDRILNGQTCDVRISFDGGSTWVAYIDENEYSAGVGNNIKIEFTMRTTNANVTPVLRAWAVFYHQD